METCRWEKSDCRTYTVLMLGRDDEQCSKILFGYALEVVENYLGKPSHPFSANTKQLQMYLLFLFDDLSTKEKRDVGKKNEIAEGKQVMLKVTIHDAEIAHPTYKALVDVYCKLWIKPKEIMFTSICQNTTKFLWDECFVLECEDYETDMLHIEVRSKHPNPLNAAIFKFFPFAKRNSISVVSGNHALIQRGCYLIGEANHFIKNLPSVRQNLIMNLVKKKIKPKIQGKITATFELSVKPQNYHLQQIRIHLLLMKRCYEKQLPTLENEEIWKTWLDILSLPGLTLIHQHAIQSGLSVIERTLCSWFVLSQLKMEQEERISYHLLHSLLTDIIGFFTSIGLSEIFLLAFKRSLNEFSVFLHEILRNLHNNFQLEEQEYLTEFHYMLSCLYIVDGWIDKNYKEITRILELECYAWYCNVIIEKKEFLKDENSVAVISKTIKKIFKDFSTCHVILDDIFHRVWCKSYSAITYKKLNCVLTEIVQPIVLHLVTIVEERKAEGDHFGTLKELLQVFFSLQDLVEYVISELSQTRENLEMEQYPGWFGENIIIEWFNLSSDTSDSFIIKAVHADDMTPLSYNIKHGTSASDAIQVIDQLVMSLWMKLKWEDQFTTHSALVRAIKECSNDFNKATVQHIKANRFFSDKKNFMVTNKLCVAFSNIHTVSHHLYATENKIRMVFKKAEEKYSFAILDEPLFTDSEIQDSTLEIYQLFFHKVAKELMTLTKNVANAKDEKIQKKAVYDLYKYVDISLDILDSHLTADLFVVILREMWIIVVRCLQSCSKSFFVTWGSTRARKRIVNGISDSLQLLEAVFHAEGFGLSLYEMRNIKYRELKNWIKEDN